MLFVFNKDKIISCAIAGGIVLVLFIFSIAVIPNSDTKLVQISSNVTNSIEDEKEGNNININGNKIIKECIEK